MDNKKHGGNGHRDNGAQWKPTGGKPFKGQNNNSASANNQIRAPFNFVPLNDKVYTPGWSKEISHDVPFKDGVSGTLTFSIEAKTPIFVRNGAPQRKDKDGKEIKETTFNRDGENGKYFIPGTSIKGAIRSVLEIISCGKMRLDENSAYAQREWFNPRLYTIKDSQSEILCGYLRRKGDGFVISDHGKPYRISHKEIDKYLGKKILEPKFSKDSQFNINKPTHIPGDQKSYGPKTANYKYKLISSQSGKSLSGLKFKEIPETDPDYNSFKTCVREDGKGDIVGDIVLTGQPDKWINNRRGQKKAGKFYEFVFENDKNDKNKKYEDHKISREEFEHFKFIYNETEEWPRVKQLIESEEGVPVFFLIEGDTINFGLSFLYKLPYDNSPKKATHKAHQQKTYDLADCIFGTVEGDKALKGRVQFSDAFAVDGTAKPEEKDLTVVLNSPKASYYPIYIEQKHIGNNDKVGKLGKGFNYSTYNDSVIKGWKRYVLKDGFDRVGNPENENNEKLNSHLTPLKAGATFTCQMNFFNLRPIELGALLSTLLFQKFFPVQKGEFYHQIGGGKPYGLGKVSIKLKDFSEDSSIMDTCVREFKKVMDETMGGNGKWLKSQQMKELILLSSTTKKAEGPTGKFSYMKMSNNRSQNEFANVRDDKTQGGQYLKYFSQIS